MPASQPKTEDSDSDELPQLQNRSIESLRTSLAPFAFSSPSDSLETVLRRSSRSPVKTERYNDHTYLSCTPLKRGLKHALEEEGAPAEVDLLDRPFSKSPRKASARASSTRSPSKAGARSTPSPMKKPKRPYAPPEKYGHLNFLDDHLSEDLNSACGFLLHQPLDSQWLVS